MKNRYGVNISILSEEDGGGYLIEVPELPGCMTDGDTIEETLAKVDDAIDSWISTAQKLGRIIPEPRYYKVEEYSGKFTTRVPKELHKDLIITAEEQGVSLNQLVNYYLAKGVGFDDGIYQKNLHRKSSQQSASGISPNLVQGLTKLWDNYSLNDIPVISSRTIPDLWRNPKTRELLFK